MSLPRQTYVYETTLFFPEEGEIDVEVSFSVSWGRPATRLGPAEDDEISDVTLTKVGDRAAPWGFHHWSDKHFAALVADRLLESEDDVARMLEVANEEEASAYDAAADARWEAGRVAA